MAEIADATDWSGLRHFASSTELSAIVGVAVAQAGRYEHEKEFLELLGSAATRDADFAAGYFAERFRNGGWSWLEPYLTGGKLSPDQVARLLLYTRDYPKAWETAEVMGEPAARIFWQRFPTCGLGGDFAHVDFVAERLLGANRPSAALDLIGQFSSREEVMSLSRVE